MTEFDKLAKNWEEITKGTLLSKSAQIKLQIAMILSGMLNTQFLIFDFCLKT